MQIDLIQDFDRFKAIQADWDAVYHADPEAHLFLSWPWLSNVFAHLDRGWRIIGIKSSDRYVAFFPLRITTYKSKRHGVFVNELVMPGRAFWADYTGFLCLPRHEEQAIARLAVALKQMNWAQLEMEHLFVSERRLSLLLHAFDRETFVVERRPRGANSDGIDNDVCPSVGLAEDFDTYLLEKTSASTRMKLRRAMRQVENAPDLKVTELSPQTYERDVDVLVGLWRNMWEERKADRTDNLTRRYRNILTKAAQAGMLYLPILWSGDRPVAALGSYIDHEKKTMYVKTTGRVRDWKKPPSGFVLHGHSIRWGIANGMKRYDFMRGDESYKYHYGSTEHRIVNVRIRTQSRLNLHNQLDPVCLSDVLDDAARYEKESRIDDAQHAYQQILETSKDHETALVRYGEMLFRAGRLPSAQKVFRRLIEIDERNARGWELLGDIHLVLREFEEAEPMFRRAISLEPSINAHFCLGCALKFQDRAREADEQLQTVLSANATNDRDLHIQDRARKIRQQLI